MRVLRGRDPRPVADREHTAALLAGASDGTPGVRVWTPPRQVAFGRRDAREPGFDCAKRIAAERGFEPIERDVGGRAVAYPGDTLAFAHAVPLGDDRNLGSVGERYDRATETVLGALRSLGADVSRGESPDSFCPGDHSVRVAGGGKVAGVAQRVRGDAALVAGCVVVTRADARAVAEVTAAVYDALGVPFDPESVGSVAEAGGPGEPKTVARALEKAFVDGAWGEGDPQVASVDRDS
ncbi:lipoate--protein ligase family protein [Halorubrum saccharovorum]|uniref:lipoate--protein ligase family protein n=1 Tax=Halorubrum saccharovorum TaxID=2248 RepID=UPI000677D111|nr:lipoate--protein ligase family protein [Halorubrum saccharovorum]